MIFERAALVLLATIPAVAQTSGGTSLTYIQGSSVKLEQVIGDCDFQAQAQQIVKGQTVTCQPTTSQTVTRFNVAGNGQGGSFEANGKMIFFFGDTISKDPSTVNYHASDPIAWSTSTDPEAGLLLNFYTNPDGSPLFVKASGITMGPDDIPNSGIDLNGQIYLICNTGSDTSLANPQAGDYSALVQFNESSQTFTAGRTISPAGGHFIGTSMHESGGNVYIFGAGPYRASDVYLQRVPDSSFASGSGTQYFAGLMNGQPTWANSEAGAVPVVQDNPLGGPAWPNDSPTIGNVSVVYSTDLGLWLMTYDGGRQTPKTNGTYFTYAPQPWGPWATPQLIFNRVRDNGYGVFIHNPSIVPDPPGDGLNGPVIGSNDPYTTAGGEFAPLMIERFIRVTGNILKIYFNLSTWNPYTIVRMRSEFTIAAAPPAPALTSGTAANGTTYVAGGLVPGSWAQVKGSNLASASRIWTAADFNGLGNSLPTNISGTSVTVNGTPAAVYFVDPSQVNFQVPAGISGTASVQVVNSGVASNTVTGAAANNAPGVVPIIANGVNYAGGVFLDGKYVGDPAIGSSFRKAKPGDTIQLYATGLAPSPAGVQVSFQSVSGVTVTLGTVTVPADAAGLVGPGEFQINFTVPPQFATLAEGNYPLTISMNGVSSPAAINSAPPGPLVIPIQH